MVGSVLVEISLAVVTALTVVRAGLVLSVVSSAEVVLGVVSATEVASGRCQHTRRRDCVGCRDSTCLSWSSGFCSL